MALDQQRCCRWDFHDGLSRWMGFLQAARDGCVEEDEGTLEKLWNDKNGNADTKILPKHIDTRTHTQTRLTLGGTWLTVYTLFALTFTLLTHTHTHANTQSKQICPVILEVSFINHKQSGCKMKINSPSWPQTFYCMEVFLTEHCSPPSITVFTVLDQVSSVKTQWWVSFFFFS